MCLKYTKHVLSKLGVSKYTPAGAFFPAKIHFLYFINRNLCFLCLQYIKHVLSKLGVSKCAPARAFFPTKNTPSTLQIHNLYVVHTRCLCWNYTHCLCLRQRFLCITYTESVLSKFGATGCAPAGAFFPAKIDLL